MTRIRPKIEADIVSNCEGRRLERVKTIFTVTDRHREILLCTPEYRLRRDVIIRFVLRRFDLSHMSAFMAASFAMSKGTEGRSEKASGQSFWRGWSEFLPSEPLLYKENQDGVCQRSAHFLRQANCGAPGAIGVPEGW
jgi:hypothetical protein